MTPTNGRPASGPVPADLARSWFLTAATRPETFASAGDVDAIILDLEDAVAPRDKPAARDIVTDRLGVDDPVRAAWVRINDATTSHWAADLDALAGLPALAGVVLAKTESGSQVDATAERLPPDTPIVPLIESAMGLEAAPEIGRAENTFRLAFGSGDFRRDTGMSDDPLAMAYPRARLVISSRAARLAGGPIDGPTVSANESILQRDCEATVSLGLTGKLCLHPDQAPVVERALSPSTHDIAWAREVIADLGTDGQHVRAGSDLPRLAKAKQLTRLAEAFGLS